MNVHASLSVDATHERVLVTFRVENRGERRIWLPRAVAADTVLSGPAFDLREHPGGAPVGFKGPPAARGPAAAGDWFELAPHSAHTHTIDITPAYAFKPGEHAYIVRYEGAALAEAHKPESAAPLATGPVVFRHTER